jgi:hypothetical protein
MLALQVAQRLPITRNSRQMKVLLGSALGMNHLAMELDFQITGVQQVLNKKLDSTTQMAVTTPAWLQLA